MEKITVKNISTEMVLLQIQKERIFPGKEKEVLNDSDVKRNLKEKKLIQILRKEAQI